MNELILKFKGRDFAMNFPNVRQFLQIESLKQGLSGGQYKNMGYTVSSNHALDMVDIEAVLTVLVPDFIKVLPVSFGELGIKDFNEIREMYREQVIPWWNEIEESLNPKKE